jgi:hypothetical protein
MDQAFTPQFWQEVIAKAPWAWVIPAVLIGLYVGWKWKGANDDSEIRGLRAEISADAKRLQLARENYEDVVKQLNQLRDKVVQQDKELAELKKLRTPAIPTVRVDKIIKGNTEIREAVGRLSGYTGSLGQALTIVPFSTTRSG